ncbi:MAG: FAD-binding oxidoreductase [Acidimicrobiales bacterium]|nr:FAD-binding oxidoreductase [Acidimicrobiales bacterium]
MRLTTPTETGLPHDLRGGQRTWPVTATTISGWGRTNPVRSAVHHPTDHAELEAAAGMGPTVARGSGRSYGDAAQNAGGGVIDTQAVNRIHHFDEQTGVITIDAGITVDTLLHATVPHGWFIAVTPGTSQVTVGGAIAADIHGKNHHHDGSFCDHVTAMTVRTGRGTEHLTPSGTPEEFWVTAGGMGLTGVILHATLQLRPVESPFITATTTRHPDLESLMAALDVADRAAGYSVAWLDGLATGRHLGRGLVITGDHSTRQQVEDSPRPATPGAANRSRSMPPVALPIVNPIIARGFNVAWYRLHRPSKQIVPYQSFFHPLDSVSNWNLLYGRGGFVQWQIVVPDEAALFISDALTELALTRAGSFLSVLKRFGPGNPSPLSFPMQGWTLAVDIPTRAPGLDGLLRSLDRRVAAVGGRVYLAKDSRLDPPLVDAMYPRLDEWRGTRDEMDPDGQFRSDLSRRLHLTHNKLPSGALR